MIGYIIITAVYFLNVATFFMFANDKHRAVLDMRRTPEFWLLFVSAMGGSLGALMGMWMFRHKTLHNNFRILVPIFLLVHIVILFVLGYVVNVLPDINL